MVPYMLFSLTSIFDNLLPRRLLGLGRKLRLIACITAVIGCSPVNELSTAAESQNMKNRVILTFVPSFEGNRVQCDQLLTIHDKEWRISAFSMFVSAFSFTNSEPIILDDNTWQSQQVALIRSATDCKQGMYNVSVQGTSASIRSLKQAGESENINVSFMLGVPFALNHQNPLLQASPLNDSSMFWVWRNGYKFLRWDMQSEADADSWSFHLGSVGCESPAMVRAPRKPCAQANTLPVDLVLTDDAVKWQDDDLHLTVRVNLDKMMSGIVPTRERTCMFSGIDNTACVQLLQNMSRSDVFE